MNATQAFQIYSTTANFTVFEYRRGKGYVALICDTVKVMKNILIVGAHSYIGKSFGDFLKQYPQEYGVTAIAARGLKPEPQIFQGIDAVFCAAGIAHVKETVKNRHLYFEVNRDFVVEVAKAAKMAGVKQFILLSSMSVYGLTVGCIEKGAKETPVSAYGESKLQADEQIRQLEDSQFLFTCLRPPMVYGQKCAGNYQSLRRLALMSPIFPNYANQRSMIYIGNLCEFAKGCIEKESSGLFFPQNAQYVNTSEMVALIAECHKKKICLTKAFNWVIKQAPINVVKKAFGNLIYEPVDTMDKYGFKQSIQLTEADT